MTGGEGKARVTIFRAGRSYALALEDVREAIELEYLTPVPTAPPAIAGVVNLRGEVLPVLNLHALLAGSANAAAALPSSAQNPPRPGDVLVVIEQGGQRAAIAVDRVSFTAPDRATAEKAEPLEAHQLLAEAQRAVAAARVQFASPVPRTGSLP